MKTLEMNEMEIVEGGLTSKDYACAFVGFAYGLANPFLGLAMGLACVAIEV